MEDIRDIKGVVPVPHYGWWCAGLAVLLLAGLAFWLWWRKHRGPAAPLVPPLTPFQAALAALAQLREGNLSVEEFYTRLSDIVRQYLEQQFRLHAPERTTEEFLYELAQGSQLTAAQKELLSFFLQESDLVKFAKLRPETADRQRAYDAAEKFVRESVPAT